MTAKRHPLDAEDLRADVREALRMIPELLDDYGWLREVGWSRSGSNRERVSRPGHVSDFVADTGLSRYHNRLRSKSIEASKKFVAMADAVGRIEATLAEIQADLAEQSEPS